MFQQKVVPVGFTGEFCQTFKGTNKYFPSFPGHKKIVKAI
jgi:hypothetical protein